MVEPVRPHSEVDIRGQISSPNSLTRRFRETLALAAFLGLLSGVGEGLIDFAFLHSSPPAIVCVTVVANVIFFVIFGLLLSLFSLGLESRLSSFLALFILLWMVLHAWERQYTLDREHSLLWLLSLLGTGFAALLLSFTARKFDHKVARSLGRLLPWILATTCACLAGAILYRPRVVHPANLTAPRAAEGLPNVVLIIVDTMRADHLSCYHYQRLTSPNLDRLAEKGVLFENAISTSSWTLPSHASMFTGLYPNQHRAQRFRDQLEASVPTLTEELLRAGYRTGAFSGSNYFTTRQGLGRGFTEFGDFSFSPIFAFTRAHYVRSVIRMAGMANWFDNSIPQAPLLDTNGFIVKWIDGINQPFFLTVNYFEVHQPKVLPPPWREHFSAGQETQKGVLQERANTVTQVTPQLQKMIDEYDSAIAYDDDCLRKLVDELSRRHLMDNTLVIVTSDHGEGLGEHGLLTHGSALYYPLIHVPLIFYWPGHLPAGSRIRTPVSTKDIAATILDLIGVSRGQLPGESLCSRQTPLHQLPKPVAELLRERMFFRRSPTDPAEIESIVSEEYQLILDRATPPQLYDWQKDPQEKDNLFLVPSYEALGRNLAAELDAQGKLISK